MNNPYNYELDEGDRETLASLSGKTVLTSEDQAKLFALIGFIADHIQLDDRLEAIYDRKAKIEQDDRDRYVGSFSDGYQIDYSGFTMIGDADGQPRQQFVRFEDFFDPDYLTRLDQKLREKREAKARQEELIRAAEAKQRENRDRAEYLRLKQKFEGAV